MDRFAGFIANDNLIAHNASFDKRFLDAEFGRIGRDYTGEFSCSLLLSRRIFQNSYNHKLGELVRFCNIESDGDFHRALYDSEMTAKVWMSMLGSMAERFEILDVSFDLIKKLIRTPKKDVNKLLSSYSLSSAKL
jgi:DNA polymerase-3 subunit epsilon